MTYMNLSGESVIAVMNFYKINIEDILVISDDLDSPFGRVRLRKEGNNGGHNGLKSIQQRCNSTQFKRIKIGIATAVLSDFLLSGGAIPVVAPKIIKNIPDKYTQFTGSVSALIKYSN